MKKVVLLLAALVLLCTTLSAQKKREMTTPVTVNYCLPKVVYAVTVELECVRQIPGPYYPYAEKQLGIIPEITSYKEQWKIKNIKVKPTYLPDESAMYAMTATGDYHAVMLSLSPEGFLAGVSAGPLAMGMKEFEMDYTPQTVTGEQEVDITKLNTFNPLKEVLDSNYIYQEIDGVMKRIWDPIVRYVSKTEDDNMTEAVKEIFRIRSERTKLVAAENEVPDGKSLEVILKEFDRMERDYLSLFLGKEEKQTIVRTFTCTPEKAGEPVVAFRFSESQGFADRKNVSATAYSIVADHLMIPAQKEVLTTEQTQSVIYYRVPAIATVRLMKLGEELQSFRDIVPQLGVIKNFPTDVISGEGLSLEFYPSYGSLKSVNKR